MKKILFFKPFDYFYLNPTIRLYVDIIENLDNVDLVDYSNFKDFSNFNDDVLVIFLPFTLLGVDLEQYNRIYPRLSKSYNVPLKDNISFDLANSYFDVFRNIHCQSTKTVSILFEYDVHALLEDGLMMNFMKRSTDFLLLSGPEFFDPEFHMNQESDIDMSKFWRGYDFLKSNEKKIISMGHIVNMSEFSYIEILQKKSRLRSAPGARYLNRKIFISNYVSLNILDLLKSYLDFIILKLVLHFPFKCLKMKFLNTYFTKIIRSSLFTYTCGSTAGFSIRKFLEIPANCSILVTHNYKFLNALGFKEGIHYLNFDNADTRDLIRKLDIYNDYSMVKLKDIVVNSRKLVFKKHSMFSYIGYLQKTFLRIQEDNFNGSYWEDGYYKFY